MELAPLEIFGGNYDSTPTPLKAYDIAKWTRDRILEKSGHYAPRDATPPSLLIYTTHFGFSLGSTELQLVQFWTTVWKHRFEAIYFHRPTDVGAAICEVVFPTPVQRWIGYDPEAFREVKIWNFDPRAWKPAPG